jgi:hypothetical protein
MTPWLEDEGVPPEVRRLLEAGKGTEALEGDALVRSHRRVTALTAVPLAAGAFFWAQQFALGAGLGIGVSVAVAAAQGTFTRAPDPPSASLRAAADVVSSRAANAKVPPLPVLPNEPPTEQRELREAQTSPVPTPRAQDSMTAEAALLEQARRSLASDPTLSLAILDEHARRYPHGALHVEREVLAVDALVRASRRSEAETRAARLRATSPGSLYQARLARILGD